MGGGVSISPCHDWQRLNIINDMTLKKARTGFVCALAAFFAFVATMGDGLHFLPGMRHCSCHSLVESDACCEAGGVAGCDPAPHFRAEVHADHRAIAADRAAACPVCMFMSLAKICLHAQSAVCDLEPLAPPEAVCISLLQSRFLGSYLSRAPPGDLRIV
jgi:hypothetical protein